MADVNLALTIAGQALRAKIEAGYGTIPLEITRIVTSSASSPDPLNLTALVAEEQTFIITGRTTSGARTTISTYLSNFGNPTAVPPVLPLAQGYPLTQIGFYALDPDDGEILYRISQFDNPNYVPAATERAWEYEPTFNIITGNATTVIINIDPSSSTTKQDVWNSVELSANSPPGTGVRTQYFIEADVSGYTPREPQADIYMLQGTFDPTTGLDDGGDPLPAPDLDNAGFYWTASAAGTFTPPGGSTPLTFNVGDWLISNGTSYLQSAPQTGPPGAAQFAGAMITEIRIVADPSNPTGSLFQVALPITVLAAVIDPDTGESMIQLLAHQIGDLGGHIANGDVHVTPVWTANVNQAIATLTTFTQRTDIFVTQQQKDDWTAAIQTAIDALTLAQNNAGTLNDMDGRLTQVEDSLFSGITANPFNINFGTLTGIVVTFGIWNAALHRVEC
jgi:hypothetical protein